MPQLGLTISGAGKLLEHATRLGMLLEISGGKALPADAAPDDALGLMAPPAPSPALDSVLATFDAERTEIGARLARIGSAKPGANVTN